MHTIAALIGAITGMFFLVYFGFIHIGPPSCPSPTQINPPKIVSA